MVTLVHARRLSEETRRLGLRLHEFGTLRILRRIEAHVGPGTPSRTIYDLALTALLMVPRPKWVRDLTGLPK